MPRPFFGHPENVLLAMATDSRPHVRELALRRILKAKVSDKGKSVRHFMVPQINFKAQDYTEVCNWSATKITCPPLLSGLTEEEIKHHIKSKEILDTSQIVNLPCHTQAVERSVKLVTEAASKVCGSDSRDGFIRATLQSRAVMPSFGTKADFKSV